MNISRRVSSYRDFFAKRYGIEPSIRSIIARCSRLSCVCHNASNKF